MHALPARVWKALTDPEEIREYMMGTTTESDWKPGSSITWSGEWQGKSYVDKGEIKVHDENKKLQYTHFSPLEGKDDLPENYRTITITLSEADDITTLHLTQDGAGSEKDKEQATKNWQGMLSGLKKLVEGKG
ncbi:MAG: SRPBCC domain-containing protein [Sphingobacteriales bacterium]|nr:MAG: SRPBCC domain-containing protein [Sphingobacteriales bacterium]